ncbi:helix-turn-helix domain-containing protein [Actinoplanes sp. G11-F43]|uniref:helix-turn-helix domain-containing protein n=1 Tax=Actinoplanes sp. G11-F43 TaxID=3424130 RepID=UPI003D33116B
MASRADSPEHASLTTLLSLLARADSGSIRLVTDNAGEAAVPDLIVDLLRQAGAILSRGDGVVVSEVARELTTSEAARVLGVSRPTLTNLLDRGDIPFHKVGTHRRVALQDLLTYRRHRLTQQRAAYEALMAEQDDLGIYE